MPVPWAVARSVVVVRAFQQADLDEAFSLDQVCFAPGIAYSKAELRYFFARPSTFAIVAERAGHMAGFLLAEWNAGRKKKPAHVITIDVAPAYRRSGIANRMMDAAEVHYREAGCTALSLEVAVDNLAAHAFYSKRGFSITGKIAGYYNGMLDAFTMSKLLADV